MEHLTGRKPRTFGPDDDGSPSPAKTILLAKGTTEKNFENLVNLISTLGRRDKGLFLAFGDSRRMIEQLVAAAYRPVETADESGERMVIRKSPSTLTRVPKCMKGLACRQAPGSFLTGPVTKPKTVGTSRGPYLTDNLQAWSLQAPWS